VGTSDKSSKKITKQLTMVVLLIMKLLLNLFHKKPRQQRYAHSWVLITQ
jgi:hypothetical protein